MSIRRAVAWAVLLVVPSAVVISLWANLNRPFWFNEQWRAYFISKPYGWWGALRTDGAPFPAGWYFLERASGAVFGSTELTLRLPTALFVPVTAVLTFLLARRWLPLAASVVVSLVAALPAPLLVFAVQLSEYQVDAAGALAVLLLHQVAADVGPGRRLYACYGGIALACVFATPALFVAAPVLLLDVLRALRGRREWARGVAATAAGIVVLIHLGGFVIRQNALTKSSYWDAQFLPHRGLGRQVSFVWHGAEGFLTGAFTGELRPRGPALLSPHWSWLLSICFAALLALGVLELARSVSGRSVLSAILGSQLLSLIASYLRYWPYGFVRTNYYLIPVLVLVAAVGAGAAVRRRRRPSAGRLSAREQPGPGPRWPQLPAARAGAALVALVAVTGGVLAAAYEVTGYRQVRRAASAVAYGDGIGRAVGLVRAEAVPGSLVVVAGYMGIDGWRYYEDEYSGRSTGAGWRPEPGHVLYEMRHGDPAVTAAVRRLRPPKVYLYVPSGTTGSEVAMDERAVEAGGECRPVARHPISGSGLLVVTGCAPG